MTLRNVIKNQILDYASEHDLVLSFEELNDAIAGVEYAVSECMADSVKDSMTFAINDVKRKERYHVNIKMKEDHSIKWRFTGEKGVLLADAEEIASKEVVGLNHEIAYISIDKE